MSTIRTPSTLYSFTYGNFALRESVKAGNRTLATYTYEYEVENGENVYRNFDLDRLAYGNGDVVEYDYDDKGRLTEEKYEDNATVTYSYDSEGELARMEDSASGQISTWRYDLLGRVGVYQQDRGRFSVLTRLARQGDGSLVPSVKTQ